MLRFAFFTCLALLLVPLAFAQSDAAPAHNLAAFAPLDLPTPNMMRTADGRPGPDYWQQRVDYHIEVTLDPATHRVSGTEAIHYTNNAPQALHYLWVQLDQNLFAADSRGARLQPPSSRWRGAFTQGGFDISRIEVIQGNARRAADFMIDDTRMRIALAEPLPPGGTLRIDLDYSFVIPEYGADRMGRLNVEQGTVYELAQWYPRMYVYDDVEGWNAMPYLGQGEFYLEYGTFEVHITVPSDFIVVAGAELQNPDEVLTETQLERLGAALESAETVRLISPDEVGTPQSRPATSEFLTWKYRAENVRDFAWAASQAFIWDAASWNGVLLMSAYPKEGLGTRRSPGWEESTQYVRHAISHYSEQWFDYPYPVAVNVAGIVGGMEYPMLAFCSVNARGEGLFGVTDHEFGHMWFPMIVGSDERRHAWMDEGLDMFINYYSTLAFYGPDAATSITPEFIGGRMQENIADQPIVTYPDRIRQRGLGFLAYRKPAMGLRILREHILGPERFDPALRTYIERWAYKHPQPADLFRTIEDATGEDLSWFWRGWFYGSATFDQAIGGVEVNSEGTTYIQLLNQDDLLLPAELEVQYTDGTTERIRVPVEAFFTTDEHFVTLPRSDVQSVRLDPDNLLPDLDPGDDMWERE